MIFKKMLWALKRHPFLYISRFRLLAKNSSIDQIASCNYNSKNSIKDIPQSFFDFNKQIFENDTFENDLDKVKQISIWFKDKIKGGPGLSEASDDALITMLNGKGGVCSDFAQVFNNFCVVNSILVREWGTTRIPFDKHFGGHSFNEVFIKELNKWVLIDVYYCVLFYDEKGKLISTIDFYEMLRSGKKITFKDFHPTAELDRTKIKNNYFEKCTAPFLICNYSNKKYDSALKRNRSILPIFIVHFLIYLSGKSYYYKFPIDNYNKI